MTSRVLFVLCLTLATANGQSSAMTPQIPVRQLAPPVAAAKEVVKSIGGLVQFSDGHVLVNDGIGKRLVLFDPSLSTFVVTADSTGTGSSLYPNTRATAALYYYLGDSAAFTDMSTQTFVIVGPDGMLGRSMAHPRTTDMRAAGTTSGGPAFDPLGRFVYRATGPTLSGPRSGPGQQAPMHTLDTLGVVRADFDSRSVDTIATVIIPSRPLPVVTRDINGKASSKMVINPIPPTADDWALLSDGSLAVVRPHDYHVDWVYADGRRASTPTMPYDWRRLTDADKLAKIDSMKRMIDSMNASGQIYGRIVTYSPGRQDTIKPTIEFVPPDSMLDYVPAIRSGTLRADRDVHLWILPTTTRSAVGGGLLYDVVNTKGEIFERVQLPPGRTIAGFGRGGVIYLSVGDRTKGFTIEKTHVIRPPTER